jgi:hypothetical protein
MLDSGPWPLPRQINLTKAVGTSSTFSRGIATKYSGSDRRRDTGIRSRHRMSGGGWPGRTDSRLHWSAWRWAPWPRAAAEAGRGAARRRRPTRRPCRPPRPPSPRESHSLNGRSSASRVARLGQEDHSPGSGGLRPIERRPADRQSSAAPLAGASSRPRAGPARRTRPAAPARSSPPPCRARCGRR